jgi:SAM-dependent methyltransferase
MDLLAPSSVLDVGCGPGGWLRVFVENGVKFIQGIDGDYLEREQLLIDPQYFMAADLTKPIRIDRKYDLAVCIEVCEHLPPPSAVKAIAELTSAAPVVLFSAAIPGQGGTNHVNEQWLCYWRDRFAERGFTMVDALRPRIRDDSRIAYYIRQNLILFLNDQMLALRPALHSYAYRTGDCEGEWIYIDLYRKWLDRGSAELGVKELLSRLPLAIIRSLRRRLRRSAPSEGDVCLTKHLNNANQPSDSASH